MDEDSKEQTGRKIFNNRSIEVASHSLPLLMDTGMSTSAHDYHTHHPNNHSSFYHHSDQTKSLQELQNEVGALLEFRDLVIETFPDLKHKMASSGASSTITGLQSSLIASRREWEPGIRVRRKLNGNFSVSKDANSNSGSEMIQSSLLTRSRSNSNSGKKEPKSGEGNGSVIQDSGFSTETSSSKEAHSSSSTAGLNQGVQGNTSTLTARLSSETNIYDSENELWSLLEVIQKQTSCLADEKDQKFPMPKSAFQNDFMRKEDIQQLRKERDHMIAKMSDYEAEVLARKVKESILQDQIQELKQFRSELEVQLKSQKREFINTADKSAESDTFQIIPQKTTTSAFLNPQKAFKDEINHLGRLDGLISNPNSKLNKVRVPDSKKIAAILLESSVVELQRHLLTVTIRNQVLQQRLEQATKSKIFLIQKMNKSKEDIEDLKFKIEERNIELEGARAQIRVMESKVTSRANSCVGGGGATTTTTRLSSDGITVMHTSTPSTVLLQQTISTPSMKAMTPLTMDETFQHSSSTESTHDQQEREMELSKYLETPRRARPSKIPLLGVNKSANSSSTASCSKTPTNRSLTKSTSSLYNGSKVPPADLSISNRPDSLRNASIDRVFRSSSIPISSKPIATLAGSSPPSATAATAGTSSAFTTVVNISSTSSPLNSKHITSSSPLPRAKRDSLTARVKNLDSLSRLQSSSTGTLLSSSSVLSSRSSNGNSNHNNNRNVLTNYGSSNRKPHTTALPVRRMSNNSVRDQHNDVVNSESVNGKVRNIRSSIWNWLKI